MQAFFHQQEANPQRKRSASLLPCAPDSLRRCGNHSQHRRPTDWDLLRGVRPRISAQAFGVDTFRIWGLEVKDTWSRLWRFKAKALGLKFKEEVLRESTQLSATCSWRPRVVGMTNSLGFRRVLKLTTMHPLHLKLGCHGFQTPHACFRVYGLAGLMINLLPWFRVQDGSGFRGFREFTV